MAQRSAAALAAKKGTEDTVAAPYSLPVPSPARLGRAVKTSERIASAIVADIVASDLKEGDRLPNEMAMTSQFGVGRGSLREALRILEVHGVISLRSGPGGGPVIIATDPRDVARSFSLYLHLNRATIRELIQARLFIEPIIVRMAAEAHEPAGLARLSRAVAAEAALPPGDPDFIAASNNFHYVLATLSGNKVIDLLATSLKDVYTTRVVAAGLVSDYTISVLLIAALSALITIPCSGAWTLFGAWLSRLLLDQRGARPFNWTMAGLLVASIAPILSE